MPQIARLKITLDNVQPRVLRRVEVPVDIRLDDLHLVIQEAMGWENYHLYEFRAGDTAWGIPDPDFPGYAPEEDHAASKSTLADILANGGGKAFKYLYDFGDGWEHGIKVEAVAEAAADADVAYPRLIAAKSACPPEDVGGPWGYGNYLEIMADPKHERHAELVEWRGPGFDPEAVDEAAIHRRLAAIAKRLARRKLRPGPRARVKPS
jgi:hypothetical protein